MPPTTKTLTAIALLATRAALVGALALSCAGFLGTSHRLLELTSHFKPQYLAAACLCLIVFALARRWRWAAAAALVVALNAAFVAPYYFPAPRAEAVRRTRVKLLLANVNAANADYQKLIDLARATAPDVLVVQEATEGWARAFEVLRPDFPHAHVVARPDTFGIAVYSRLPLGDVRTVDLGGAKIPAVTATVETAETRLSLVTAHVYPPLAGMFEGRNEQLAQLAALANASARPVVLVGDLNVSPWSPYFATLARETGLRDARLGFGVLPTWPTYRRVMSVPIDHCLVSAEVTVVSAATGAGIGSDHLPLVVTLEVPDARPTN